MSIGYPRVLKSDEPNAVASCTYPFNALVPVMSAIMPQDVTPKLKQEMRKSKFSLESEVENR